MYGTRIIIIITKLESQSNPPRLEMILLFFFFNAFWYVGFCHFWALKLILDLLESLNDGHLLF